MSKTAPALTRNRSRQFGPFMGVFCTLLLVVIVRESASVLCHALGYGSASNIVGMIAILLGLLLWRMYFDIPLWLTRASGVLLLDSGFAFLPVSAGAGLLLLNLGDELWGFIITVVVSTLLPLWGLALLANLWLSRYTNANKEIE